MSLAIGRKARSAWLPTQTNSTAEFSVPHPPRVPGQTRDRPAIRKNYARPFGFSIDLLRKETIGILGNSPEMLAGGLWPAIVRRPAFLQRMNIARKVLGSRPNQFH